MQQQRTQGVTVGPVEDLKAMVSAIAAYKMRPVIDRIFRFVMQGTLFRICLKVSFGKIALTIYGMSRVRIQ
jgi:hypothetical protein